LGREGRAAKAAAKVTAEEELQGLHDLTMTGELAAQRDVSFANVKLPPMQYDGDGGEDGEDGQGYGGSMLQLPGSPSRCSSHAPGAISGGSVREQTVPLKRTTSVPNLTAIAGLTDGPTLAKAEERLAYWKLETEIRLTKDTLLSKDEQVDALNKHKDLLEEEMGDLTVTLFEEANEMVQVEQEARHRDHVLLKETQEQTVVLQAELKALKEIVSHLRSNGGSTQAYLTPGKGGGAAGAAAAAAATTPNQGKPYDTWLFNELMQWKGNPSVMPDNEFMRRIMIEDVQPCMRFHPKTKGLSGQLLVDIREGQLIVEMAKSTNPAEDVCTLTLAKRLCAHRVKRPTTMAEGPEWYSISGIARNRLIALCELFRYLGYIAKGLVKASIADIYWKIVDLRLDVNKARLGLEIG
jgi:Rab-3A-interacting protein